MTNSSGFKGAKSTQMLDDFVLSRDLVVAPDKEGLTRGLALKRSLAEDVVHERAHVQGNLSPERFIVWFEGHPFETAIDAFFDKESLTANWNVFVFASESIVSRSSVTPQLNVI